MRNGVTHLFVPGPTNVPEPVRCAMNVPMQDHRAPDFPELTLPLFTDLKTVFGNESGRVFIYPSSGTGAWEAAISNTLNRGDRVLMSRFGQFSQLWADMAQRLGLDVICIDREWGEGVPLQEYELHLREDKTIRAVFVTHNETATGVTSDVLGVRQVMDATGSDALLHQPGRLGIIGRSGTLGYEAASQLKALGVGVPTSVGIGAQDKVEMLTTAGITMAPDPSTVARVLAERDLMPSPA